ncbi:MAG: DegT/DnrJ/EryC1/StrS family aminotransferase, partial [Chloroflexota bacterium]
MRDSFLLYSSPDLGDEELAEVAEVLRSGWITTGPKARLLESEFGAAVGAKHAIAVSSCTAAMHLALEASGLLNGEEVITTPYTFASTAAVILHCGARPVLVDIQPDTLNINPDLIEAAITERTRA